MAFLRQYFLHGMALAIALGAVFAFLGVYDTHTLPFFKRFVFWTSTMIVGNVATSITAPWIFTKAMRGQPLALQAVATALIISFPVTVVVMAFQAQNVITRPLIWLLQYGYVAVIALIVTGATATALVAMGFLGERKADSAGQDNDAPDPIQKFMDRLPVAYRGAAIYAVSSEDHYCRIHTSEGEELILLRLADALRDLEGADGLQTHRSWWVAKDGVADVRRDNGRLFLKLKSGAEAPVSRSFATVVKEAGLG